MIRFWKPNLRVRPDPNSHGLVEVQKRHLQALLMNADDKNLARLIDGDKYRCIDMSQNVREYGRILTVDLKPLFGDRVIRSS